jgi:hypothetical protein
MEGKLELQNKFEHTGLHIEDLLAHCMLPVTVRPGTNGSRGKFDDLSVESENMDDQIEK